MINELDLIEIIIGLLFGIIMVVIFILTMLEAKNESK